MTSSFATLLRTMYPHGTPTHHDNYVIVENATCMINTQRAANAALRVEIASAAARDAERTRAISTMMDANKVLHQTVTEVARILGCGHDGVVAHVDGMRQRVHAMIEVAGDMAVAMAKTCRAAAVPK